MFSHKIFWLWILDSIWQSLVSFGIGVLAFDVDADGRTWDMWHVGTVIYTSVVFMVTLKLMIEAEYITRMLVITVTVSMASYLAFLLLYHAILPDVNRAYFAAYQLMADSTFWLAVILAQVAGLGPAFCYRAYQAYAHPNAALILREAEARGTLGTVARSDAQWEQSVEAGDGTPQKSLPIAKTAPSSSRSSLEMIALQKLSAELEDSKKLPPGSSIQVITSL